MKNLRKVSYFLLVLSMFTVSTVRASNENNPFLSLLNDIISSFGDINFNDDREDYQCGANFMLILPKKDKIEIGSINF